MDLVGGKAGKAFIQGQGYPYQRRRRSQAAAFDHIPVGVLQAGREEAPQAELHTREWITEALGMPGLETVPITPETAWDSTSLPDCPVSDPADQIITATARTTSAALITADSRLLAYPHVRTLW